MTRGTRARGQGTARGATRARGNATTATTTTTATRPTAATTVTRPTAATTVTRPAQARARAPLAPIPINTPPSTDPEEGRNEDQEPQEPLAYVGKRKRTYDEIAGALSIRATTKRQKIDNEILEPYYQLGRWTQRGIDLDPDVHHIVKVGIALSEDFSEMEGIESFAALEEVLDPRLLLGLLHTRSYWPAFPCPTSNPGASKMAPTIFVTCTTLFKVVGRKNGKSKRVAPKDVVPSTSTFNKLIAAEAARSLRRAEKVEECRQHEEAERRQAEAAARQKALEHIRAQRQQWQQPAQPEEDDGDGGDGSEGGVVGQGEGEGTDDEMDGAGEGGEGEEY
ncbi:hypothetical protein VKT23_018442 [Stygiomarasmius scandens]|uniref:Uncharacterized protein n=1 Tax=Marasmiellus scandens TaxID=2682957 RepID=A0ABR1IP60_9AGAR